MNNALLKTPPTATDLLLIVVAASKATVGSVRLTHSDGDLAAHIAIGLRIVHDGALPAYSIASYTAAHDPFVAHAWLSEVLFALLYRAGGLALIAVVTAVTIAVTHALVVEFLRRRGVDPRIALLACLLSLAIAATHWLARPHMFSILASMLTLILLESRTRRRTVLIAALFVLWANLHGGWIAGLVLIGAYAMGNWIDALRTGGGDARLRAADDTRMLVVAAAATLVNPYLWRLHAEVFSAAASPLLASTISEYLPPRIGDPATLGFFIGIAATVVLLALSRARMPTAHALALLAALIPALASARGIPRFGVVAWPLVILHASRALPGFDPPLLRSFARIDRTVRSGFWSAVAVALLVAVALNQGRVGGTSIVVDRFQPTIFPVEAVARARDAGLHGRVFTRWVWSGYLLLAWPDAILHVDPLKFSRTTIDSYSRLEEAAPGWQNELDQWEVDMVLLSAGAELGPLLGGRTGVEAVALRLHRSALRSYPREALIRRPDASQACAVSS
jgi:hypothetical protein